MDWTTYYSNVQLPDIRKMIENPDEWQILLANKIKDIVGTGTVLEAGCGLGLTSLLVGESINRTMLDVEPMAITTAKTLFDIASQRGSFVIGSIFSMDFPDETFDMVFNAGVLEHFSFSDRKSALMEMIRVTKKGGRIIAAVPNHYSIPYHYSYKYCKSHKKWPYPDEEVIYDFSKELVGVSEIISTSRETVCEKAIYNFLPRHMKLLYRILNKFKKYEGYLTIITIKK